MGLGGWTRFLALWGCFVTIFWMVCAWRAIRAHERLADAAAHLAGRSGREAE